MTNPGVLGGKPCVVHANPKTAGIVRRATHWERSDVRHYAGLDPDSLTTVHPAFRALGPTQRIRWRRYRALVEQPSSKSRPSGAPARSWGRAKFPLLERAAPSRRRAPSGPMRRRWAFMPALTSVRNDALAHLVL